MQFWGASAVDWICLMSGNRKGLQRLIYSDTSDVICLLAERHFDSLSECLVAGGVLMSIAPVKRRP